MKQLTNSFSDFPEYGSPCYLIIGLLAILCIGVVAGLLASREPVDDQAKRHAGYGNPLTKA